MNLFEEIMWETFCPTKKKIENTTETKVYRFMTNFDNKDRHIYEKALSVTNQDMFLKDEAFYGRNHDIKLDNHGALWVNVNVGDCSNFWDVFRAIEKYYE